MWCERKGSHLKTLIKTVCLAMALIMMSVSALAYTPGEYTAEAMGHAGYIQVTVVIGEDGRITDVKAVGDMETPTVGGYALLDLPAEFIKAQSADIDAYTGATNTRNGMVEAVQACLDQAGGGPVETAEEAPEEAAAEEAAEPEEAEAAEEAAPAEEAAAEEAPAEGTAVEAGPYTPGEYTAEAMGHAGYIQVTVTIDENGRIADVKAVGDMETPTVGGYALLDLPAEFIKAQSADIDAYTGATNTRNGMVEAVQACLDQATAQ